MTDLGDCLLSAATGNAHLITAIRVLESHERRNMLADTGFLLAVLRDAQHQFDAARAGMLAMMSRDLVRMNETADAMIASG